MPSGEDLRKVGHVRLSKAVIDAPIVYLSIWKIDPSPENSKLYRPVTPDDDETLELADSIKKDGILEPLIVSDDLYIISGHRRHTAAPLAGLTKVPCRIRRDVTRGDGPTANPKFLELLRECNRQRVKSRDELMRETVIDVDPETAYRALIKHRRKKAKLKIETIQVRASTPRKEISAAKQEFLRAAQHVINVELVDFLPTDIRSIHYRLLNDPPLIHSEKPNSRYRNNLPSYGNWKLCRQRRCNASSPRQSTP